MCNEGRETQERIHVFLGDAQVTVTQRTAMKRLNRQNGHEFTHYMTVRRIIFRIDKQGLVYSRAFFKSPGQVLCPMSTPWLLLEFWLENAPPEVRALVPRVRDVFPSAAHWQARGDRLDEANTRIRSALRQEDLPAVTRAIFGMRHYRKDLARATADSTLYTLFLARQFRGLVPTDWLVAFLRREDGRGAGMGHGHGLLSTVLTDLRPALARLDERSRRAMLLTGELPAPIVTSDILTMLRQGAAVPEGRRVRSLVELHDVMAEQGWRAGRGRLGVRGGGGQIAVKREVQPLAITGTDLQPRLQAAAEAAGLEGLVFPTTSTELVEWSETLSNCIWSYGARAAKGDTQLGGVEVDGKLVAAFEIAGGAVRQFQGRFNQPVPELKAVWDSVFAEVGVASIPAPPF